MKLLSVFSLLLFVAFVSVSFLFQYGHRFVPDQVASTSTPSARSKSKKLPPDLFVAVYSQFSDVRKRSSFRERWSRLRTQKTEMRFFTEVTYQEGTRFYGEQQRYSDIIRMEGNMSKYPHILFQMQWALSQFNFGFFVRVSDDASSCLESLLAEKMDKPTQEFLQTLYNCSDGSVLNEENFLWVSKDIVELLVKASQRGLLSFADNNLSAVSRGLNAWSISVNLPSVPHNCCCSVISGSLLLLRNSTLEVFQFYHHQRSIPLNFSTKGRPVDDCPSIGSLENMDYEPLMSAVKCLQNALQRKRVPKRPRLMIATVFESVGTRLGNTSVHFAEQLLVQAVEIFEFFAQPHVALAIRLTHKYPYSAKAWVALGKTLTRVGSKEAIFAFATALKLDGTYSMSLFHQAQLLTDINSYDARVLSQCAFNEASKSGKLMEPFRSAAAFAASDENVKADLDVLDDIEEQAEIRVTSTRDLFVSKMRSIINAEIKGLVHLRRAFLIDYPDHDNAGDSAIWWGEVAFCAHDNVTLIPFNCSCFDCDIATLKKSVLPSDVLLLHGGGNFGDFFSSCNTKLRHDILHGIPSNRIIIFPQTTVPWFNEDSVAQSVEIYSQHKSVTLMARDQVSYLSMRSLYSNRTRVGLVPDMAFWLPYKEAQLLQNNSVTHDIVWLGRSDIEKHGLDPVGEKDVIVVDWFGPGATHPNMSASYDSKARYAVDRAFNILSRGKVVVSDRLHGHLLALLLGKPHIILDNSYGKVRQFYMSWTKGNDYTFPAGSTAEALELARILVKNYDHERNRIRWVPELRASKNRWLTVPGGWNAFPEEGLKTQETTADRMLHHLACQCSDKLSNTHIAQLSVLPLPSSASDNLLTQRLYRYADDAVDREHTNELVITFVTSEYVDFAINWAHSLDAVNCNSYLIIALDVTTFEALEKHGKKSFLLEYGEKHGDLRFQTAEFLQVMRLRAWIVAVLARKYSLLVSDIDVLILKNPLEAIHKVEGFDIFLTSDQPMGPANPSIYNGGFFYLRNSLATKKLTQAIYRTLVEDKQTNDQQALNTIVRSMTREGTIRATVLHPSRYQMGYDYYEFTYVKNESRQHLVMAHLNWLYTAQSKRLRLEESGLQLYSRNSQCICAGRMYLLPFVSGADGYLAVRRILINSIALALETRRILILPKVPRFLSNQSIVSPSDTSADWRTLSTYNTTNDSLERFLEVRLLDEALGAHGYCANRYLSSDIFTGVIPYVVDTAHSDLPQRLAINCTVHCVTSIAEFLKSAHSKASLLLLHGDFSDDTRMSQHYASAEKAVWHTEMLRWMVGDIFLKEAPHTFRRICLRMGSTPSSSQTHDRVIEVLQREKCTVDLRSTAGALAKTARKCELHLFLSVPPNERKYLRESGWGALLLTESGIRISDGDQFQVPYDLEGCIQAESFYSDECDGDFAAAVCSKRDRHGVCCNEIM